MHTNTTDLLPDQYVLPNPMIGYYDVIILDRREEYAQKRKEYFDNPFLRSGVTNFGTPRLLSPQAF